MEGIVEGVIGLALFLFPGAAWVSALAPGLPRPAMAALAVVMAFTITPMVLFALHLLFHAPIALGPMAFLAVALGLAGVAVRVRGRLVGLVGA